MPDHSFRIFGSASGNGPRSPEVPGILSGSACGNGCDRRSRMARSMMTSSKGKKTGSGAEPAGFPLRVACVDMGSNAIRFLAAEFSDETEYTVLASERRPVRLGHSVFLSGVLDAGAMDAAVEALTDFKRQMDELDVQHYRAVATSAVREAKNGDEFVKRIKNEAGLKLEVISGSEEARLVHTAVATRIPLGDRKWLLVDLGGGSVEVSLVDQTGSYWSESHTMGSVRLLEELTGAGADPGRFRRLLAEYIAVLKMPVLTEGQPLAGYIATGGNIEALAKLAGFPDEMDVTHLPVDRLHEVRAVVKIYEYRWAIDTIFERTKRELHLDEFMVRQWAAIECLLWAGAMVYILVLLRLETHKESRRFLAEVLQLLRQRAIMGKKLTVGKFREAIALDYTDYREQWPAALHEAT